MKIIHASPFLIFTLSLTASLSQASSHDNSGSAQCQEGGSLRAITVAYQDFSSFLTPYHQKTSRGDLGSYLSDIENYEIRAATEGNLYVITFSPGDYSGRTIKGGGAQYLVRKCSFRIEGIRGRAPLD